MAGEENRKRRVLVIGAGASGLTAIKTCLEDGLEPVCLEMEHSIGGLWYFTQDERHSTVYKSTVINTSKEMMAFSDFPIPEHYPPFMRHDQIIEYFDSYAKHFGLYKYIRFGRKVELVTKATDYDQTGNWLVKYSHDGVVEEEVFEAVVVSSGHHWKPRLPNFPGMEKFKGVQKHSHSYKEPAGYEGKVVVVVGIGNSGVDLAVELSRVAKQVYLSTRSGSYIMSRINADGLPLDLVSTRALSWLPFNSRNKLFESFVDQKNLETSGLKPKFGPLNAHPTIHGEIFGRIFTGSIKVVPNIQEIREKSVIFDGGLEVEPDEIIYSTGYIIEFPFIHPSAEVVVNDNQIDLYKFVFPPTHKHSTMAFLGLIQPWGAIMPISEMQIRWAAQVFNGKLKLPPKQEMIKDIKQKREEMAKRYKNSPRHTIQVEYVSYMDEIAKIVGVYPTFWDIITKRPHLLKAWLVGPTVPAQYRLFGPHSWDKAEEIVKDPIQRSLSPLRKRIPPKKDPLPVPSIRETLTTVSLIGVSQLLSRL